MFFDLNVSYLNSEPDLLKCARSSREREYSCAVLYSAVGYGLCAFSVHVPGAKHIKPNAMKLFDLEAPSDGNAVMVPSKRNLLPFLTHLETNRVLPKEKQLKFKQMSRITIDLNENSELKAIGSSSTALNTYDIVAVCPKNEKIFQSACNSADIDIVSLDFSEKMPFFIKAAPINLAIQRGIVFEIQYSAAVRDAASRKAFITNATQLVKSTRGMNIIISSGAKHAMELRGPYDIMNLSHLFGLSQDKARKAMTETARHVLYHSATRTETYNGVISATKIQPPVHEEPVMNE